jgi:hypothetical protein
MSARLNIFQRTMRRWDALHPYNAAQVMFLRDADAKRVADAWRPTLARLGLGVVRVNGGGFVHAPLRDDARGECVVLRADATDALPHPNPLPGGEGADGVSSNRQSAVGNRQFLDQHLTAELNRPFDPHEDAPFRAFVMPQPDGTLAAGVAYQHWVADSVTVRRVIREWFCELFEPTRRTASPLPMLSGGYWRNAGPERGGWGLVDGVLRAMRTSSRLRRVRRVRAGDESRLATRFASFDLPDGLGDALRVRARRDGATVNDAFVAAAALACLELAPLESTPRRPDLAFGTIVDLRSRVGASDEPVGLLLGFMNTVWRPHELASFEAVLRSAARQSRHLRDTHAIESSWLTMVMGSLLTRRMRPGKLLGFYRKRMPLAGGISNVNMTRDWTGRYHPAPLAGYLRVSPAGPLLPIVFTPSTLGRTMNLGLTWREGVIDTPTAHEIARRFVDRLVAYAS